MTNQMVSMPETGLHGFAVSLATTEAELGAVDDLWRAVYGRERGWIDPLQRGCLYRDRYHDHSIYLLASAEGHAVGTMRLVLNSGSGLPVEQFVSLNEGGGATRSIECQRLMVLPAYRKRRDEQRCPYGVFAALMKATLHHCLENRITHVVADLFLDTDTTPRRQLAVLGFRELGEPFVDFELTEASKSIALILEIADLLATTFRDKDAFHRYLVTPDEACLPRRSDAAAQ